MAATSELKGWLLDLYPNPHGGVTLWLIGEDGKRYQLNQKFPITFYVAGKNEQLRAVWRYLQAGPIPVSLSRTARADLFSGMTTVLAVEVTNPTDQPHLLARLCGFFSRLGYSIAEAKIHTTRHGYALDSFMLLDPDGTLAYRDMISLIENLSSAALV